MVLRKMDFLCVAPQNFIFQNKSNKTNFGGLLTLIFMIITLILFAFYLINFITEQTYSVEYVFYEELMDDENFMENFYNSSRYNPYFKFNLDLIYLQFSNLIQENQCFYNILNLSLFHGVMLQSKENLHLYLYTPLNYKIYSKNKN